jgi:hypothetical protein
MAALLVFASSYGGFAALALGMSRYRQQVWRRTPSTRARSLLRAIGALGLSLALWACVAHFDWAMGLVWWTAMLTVSSLLLALAITYRPRLVALSAALAWLLAGVTVALQ